MYRLVVFVIIFKQKKTFILAQQLYRKLSNVKYRQYHINYRYLRDPLYQIYQIMKYFPNEINLFKCTSMKYSVKLIETRHIKNYLAYRNYTMYFIRLQY